MAVSRSVELIDAVRAVRRVRGRIFAAMMDWRQWQLMRVNNVWRWCGGGEDGEKKWYCKKEKTWKLY